jgi:hypothetical protein
VVLGLGSVTKYVEPGKKSDVSVEAIGNQFGMQRGVVTELYYMQKVFRFMTNTCSLVSAMCRYVGPPQSPSFDSMHEDASLDHRHQCRIHK